MDTTKFPNDAKYFFEVEIKTSNASLVANARLYNVSDDMPASLATVVTTTSVNADRVRSGEFTPTSGAKEYKAQFAATSGASATIISAMIWVETTYQGTGERITSVAPIDATYLVTVSNTELTAEVVVGVSPGGELGGTWNTPTVDSTHSGSKHPIVQATEPSLTPTGQIWLDTSTDATGTASLAIATKAANYTITDSNAVILCNAAAGVITITLPTAVGKLGRVYNIKKIDSSSFTVTVDGNGSETIDDGTSAILTVQYEAITIISDGTEWWIL